jgi:5-methylcytosine-specific restriction protein A
MPNWQGSDRRDRLPADWPLRRAFVLDRDGHSCRHIREDTGRPCGVPAHDVDHIRNNDDHGYHNLQALCEYHHRQKSGREGGLASGKSRQRAKEARAPKHPGLI